MVLWVSDSCTLLVLVMDFGMRQQEMLTRRNPHAFWLKGLSVALERPAHISDICQAVVAGSRLPLPKGTPTAFGALIHDCWLQDPALRPTMAQVRDRLLQLGSGDGTSSGPEVRFLSVMPAVSGARGSR